ncbi:MAG TPA: MFS transporter [Acidimicrobiia bacterium]|nr:MFS transporter [Acidimicrobiia bacterium]
MAGPRLGLRQNLPQFALLVAVNALVGGMIGQERTVLPLLAEVEFGLDGMTTLMTFVVAFGVTKALVNLAAGRLADRFGRKPVLVAGWLFGIPVPFLLMLAPTWSWVVFANVLLGVNQGLAWSVTVIMKIDLVGPTRRGTAMGLNEAAGYGAVAVVAWLTGVIAESAGVRPAPFFLGVAFAALGLGLSVVFVRETAGHVDYESARTDHAPRLTGRQVFALATWRHRSLATISRAGLVNNLNEGMAWGLFPIHFAMAGLDLATIGLLVAVSPGVWGVGQLFTGALSDRIGRRWLIVAGQFTEAAGLLVVALGGSVTVWALGSALFGAGTALAYPTLLAAVGDLAHPRWRASAVGVYRLWRDLGFAVGAIVAGTLADLYSVTVAIVAVAAVTALSGADVAAGLDESLPRSIPSQPVPPNEPGQPPPE